MFCCLYLFPSPGVIITVKSRLLLLLGIIIFCCLIFFSPLSLQAQEDETNASAMEIANSLSRHLGGLASLSFSFTQTTEGQISGRTRQAGGLAFFVKQDESTKMRWNYETPDTQVIISDGEQLTMYFANLNQMIIAPADQLQQDVTYAFFTGETNIDEKFIIAQEIIEQDLNEVATSEAVIKLIPRSPTSQVQYIRLWVTAARHIHQIVIVDNFETITTIFLNDIQENSLTDNGKLRNRQLFTFTPPAGTEIIRQ